jgi:hypothetical protein
MPVPQALVTRFFQLLVSRQFAEAERELERLKQKMHKTEWNRGYFRALYGLYLSRRTNGDPYAFFPKLDLSDKAVLHSYKREFSEHVSSKLHGDYDKGFFAAWEDCMRVISKMNVPSMNGVTPENGKIQTLKSDAGQATMESFIKEEEED